MTDEKPKNEKPKFDDSNEHGHRQTDLHKGAASITEMGDYALSEAQKVALGIHTLDEAMGIARGEETEVERRTEWHDPDEIEEEEEGEDNTAPA